MLFVSRGGEKLAFALRQFAINPQDKICADFGANKGGFTDCLLQAGAAKVYAVETGYGLLEWKLRNDPRVVTLERSNALQIKLPEKVALLVIDTGWTKLATILPNALKNLQPNGQIIALLKPHYEAGQAKITDQELADIIDKVSKQIEALGLTIKHQVESPLLGQKGGNREFLLLLQMP